MTCKFIEISSGQDLPTRKFEIVQVQKDTFMLKTKDSHIGLIGALNQLLVSNYSMDESSYSAWLWKKSSSMRWALGQGNTSNLNADHIPDLESMIKNASRRNSESMIKNSPRPNPESMIKNSPRPNPESMIKNSPLPNPESMIKNSPRPNPELMIVKADYSDEIFIGGQKKLMQWSIGQKKVTKDFGSIMAGRICSMVQTRDKNYLFISDNEGS
jgi:hypothetical protein